MLFCWGVSSLCPYKKKECEEKSHPSGAVETGKEDGQTSLEPLDIWNNMRIPIPCIDCGHADPANFI